VPKIIKNWLAANEVIAKIIRLTFLAHPVNGITLKLLINALVVY